MIGQVKDRSLSGDLEGNISIVVINSTHQTYQLPQPGCNISIVVINSTHQTYQLPQPGAIYQ